MSCSITQAYSGLATQMQQITESIIMLLSNQNLTINQNTKKRLLQKAINDCDYGTTFASIIIVLQTNMQNNTNAKKKKG